MNKERMLSALYGKEKKRLKAFLNEGPFPGEVDAPVFGTGNPESRIMLIGEAPGREETEAGLPFVGKAGRQLNDLLSSARIERDLLYVTNCVKYRPYEKTEHGKRNRTPSLVEIKDGISLLKAEIEIIGPAYVVTLGNTPLTAIELLTGGINGKIGELHGKPFKCCMNDLPFVLFPMYHPASVIYNRKLIDTMNADCKDFCELAVNNL